MNGNKNRIYDLIFNMIGYHIGNYINQNFIYFCKEFGKGKNVSKTPFKRIKYRDSMIKYGTDKPDLRNPIEIVDVTSIMQREDVKLEIFKKLIKKGSIVRALPAPNCAKKSRSFFDEFNNWAKEEGGKGLGYIILEKQEGIEGYMSGHQ